MPPGGAQCSCRKTCSHTSTRVGSWHGRTGPHESHARVVRKLRRHRLLHMLKKPEKWAVDVRDEHVTAYSYVPNFNGWMRRRATSPYVKSGHALPLSLEGKEQGGAPGGVHAPPCPACRFCRNLEMLCVRRIDCEATRLASACSMDQSASQKAAAGTSLLFLVGAGAAV